MSKADRRKWDERYREGSYATRTHATALLEQFLASLPRGRALDVGCGTGRNALRLAADSYEVDGVDVSPAGLDRAASMADAAALRIRWIEADLERGLPDEVRHGPAYDLILMIRYVNGPLIPALLERLSPDGVFLCEQHLKTARDVIGPRNPAYRVEPNALLDAVRGMRVLLYREGIVTDPDGRQAALAQTIATRGTAVELDYC